MVRHPPRLLAPEVGEVLVRRPVPPPVDVRRDLAVADEQEVGGLRFLWAHLVLRAYIVMLSARHHRAIQQGLLRLGYHRAEPPVDVSRLAGKPAPPPGDTLPVPPAEAEHLFGDAPFELTSAEPTSQGVAGAQKAEVLFPNDGRRLQAKWKVAPRGTCDSWNNNPRKEIACYAVQRWFLDATDYVVPAVALRSIPLDAYRRIDPKATPTLDGTDCVIGVLALWLQHATAPDRLYDPERFLSDHPYAYHLSNLNVLTYLVDHRDGRTGNFLAADDESNRRGFAIDNGISFGSWIWNFLTTNWNLIRVPAIRRTVVERLRGVDAAQLEALGWLAELRADAEGGMCLVGPTKPIDPSRGARVEPGRVQLGLTTAEIAGVAERITMLIDDVDRGALEVF